MTVKVDWPMGTNNPTKAYYYPINYGYIKGASAPDGEDLDAYSLGLFEPVHTFMGLCIAVIHRTDDEDDKLMYVPEGV